VNILLNYYKLTAGWGEIINYYTLRKIRASVLISALLHAANEEISITNNMLSFQTNQYESEDKSLV